MAETPNLDLAQGATALAAAASEVRAWVTRLAQSASSVANEQQSLAEATLRAENNARKLAASANRRNSAGVFGPSQAGKSYLVSVLGRSPAKPLMADFAGTQKNFITEINPQGGKESTGLVTRFTIVKGTRDAKHPVELRLLTETDLVKIIGNSFISDFDQDKRTLTLPQEAAVREAVQAARGARRATNPHLDEVVMFDIGEYFKTIFPVTVEPLTRAGYWEGLVECGHLLPVAERTALYSQLWGRSQDLTDLFLLLLRALEDLHHAPTALAVLECLVPRETSIIDVDTLQKLGGARDKADAISVIPESPDGKVFPAVPVPRATLTALVAEIKVVMAEGPWSFFQHTDLLDFPGARAREKLTDLPAEPEARTECVRKMLLRGKIAYLFQRYTDERELACMLLCMAPGNQEVKDLTGLVGRWVAQTHGESHAARGKLPCALLFMLTQFDKELSSKPGDTPEAVRDRIKTRLEASMYQLFKQEDWLQNWNGKPFANTFFLRNPGFIVAEVFQYQGEGDARTESGVLPASAERLSASRQGMIESELGRRHFADPAQAWDSAMTLNDGGVAYLVRSLEGVLSAELKPRQLVGRLKDQVELLEGRLKRFYRGQDDSSRQEKEQALMRLRRQLYSVVRDQNYRNFAQLLTRMKLAEADVRGVFLNVASLKLDAAAEEKRVPAPVADPADDPWAEAPAPAKAVTKKAASSAWRRDRPDLFASHVLNLWTERVRAIAADEGTLKELKMDAQTVGDLGNELIVGAHRLQLTDQIAARVREKVATANVRWDEVADSAAGIAAMVVNDFVAYLGFGDLPDDKRPAYPEPPKPRQRGVFGAPPVPARGTIPVIGEQRAALEQEYFMEWGVALRQFGVANIDSGEGREIGEADNSALGAILTALAPAKRVQAH